MLDITVVVQNTLRHAVQYLIEKGIYNGKDVFSYILDNDLLVINMEDVNEIDLKCGHMFQIKPFHMRVPSMYKRCYIIFQKNTDCSHSLLDEEISLNVGDICVYLEDATVICLSKVDIGGKAAAKARFLGHLDDFSSLNINVSSKKNIKISETSGKLMCCEWARGMQCMLSECPFAHVYDGRPCQQSYKNELCPFDDKHGVCYLQHNMRIPSFFHRVRTDPYLAAIGGGISKSSKELMIYPIPSELLACQNENDFDQLLPDFLDKITPPLLDIETGINKYFDTIALNVYQKWQAYNDKGLYTSITDPSFRSKIDSMDSIYPGSWKVFTKPLVETE